MKKSIKEMALEAYVEEEVREAVYQAKIIIGKIEYQKSLLKELEEDLLVLDKTRKPIKKYLDPTRSFR